MAAFKGTQDTLGPRSPTPPKKQMFAHSRCPVRPLGGEGERERERERKGMWVDQGGGGLVLLIENHPVVINQKK